MGLARRRFLALLAAPALVARAEAPGFAANFDGASLLDQEGRRFSFAPLAGKVLLVNFVYTGCSTVCPIQTRALAEVQAALPPDVAARVRFVSISLDPLQDTPAALKAFATTMRADLTRWSFVTGRPTDVDRIAQRLRLFRAGPNVKRPDDHATGLWAVDAKGRLVQRYAGNPPDRERLVRELTALARIADRKE
jgi:cytochrome oxidase Cu insertion factor (SCO1/SenC/PrrC family)